MSVKLTTSHGVLIVKLYWRECPKTCRNFIELSKCGFYDGSLIYRIVPDFLLQTGDPFGDGTGGESIYGPYFEDEIRKELSHDKPGVVSMANTGRNRNGSQFVITFAETKQLDGKHTIFGQVDESCFHVLQDLQKVKTKNGRPVKKPYPKIYTAEVLENPWEGAPLPEGCRIPDVIPQDKPSGKCILM